MTLQTNENNALNALKQTLIQKYQISDIKLYGSKAKGKADKDSDLDIFILADKIDWQAEKDIYNICFELSLQYDVLLSPIIFTEEETKNRLIRATPFYQNIEKEGISI